MLTKKWKAKAKASKKKYIDIFIYIYIYSIKRIGSFWGRLLLVYNGSRIPLGGDPTALRVAFKETRHSDLQH
jgi:hypothetical protein